MLRSDYARLRPQARPSLIGFLALLPFRTELVASVFLRTQQRLMRGGHVRLAWIARTLGGICTGADFVPGVEVGPGVLLSHPSGLVLGSGARIGRDVTFASGVVLGVRSYDHRDPEAGNEPYPTIGDGVFLGAHAVILGGVHVGDHAVVGANSVVIGDVPDHTIVSGIPAKPIGERAVPDGGAPSSTTS